MSEPIYLTAEGAEKLKLELADLKGPQREALSVRLRDAIQMGDLSENADYHKAKEDQGFLEGRIQELEYTLNNAIIVDGTARKDLVSVGMRVTVQEDDFEPETWFLVSLPVENGSSLPGPLIWDFVSRPSWWPESGCSEDGQAPPRRK